MVFESLRRTVAIAASAAGLATIAIVGGGAPATAATCSSGNYPGAVCLWDGDYYSGTKKTVQIGYSYAPGKVFTLWGFQNKANSAKDADPGNNWDLYNERSGIYPDTRIQRIPIGGSIGILNTRNVVDYIKNY